MIMAYQDIPVESLIGQAHQTLEVRRKHLFDTYIERMFRRKGKSERPFSDEQTKNWLAWLAQQMARHNQTIFLIEQLQPRWLSSRRWSWVYVLGSRSIGMLFCGLMAGLAMGVGGAKYMRFNDTLIPGLGGWLVCGLVAGLICGMLGGLIDGVRFERRDKDLKKVPTRWQQGINFLMEWLIFGLAIGLVSGLFAGPVTGLCGMLMFGLICGLVFGLRGSRQSLTNDIQTVEALSWSWNKALKTAPLGLIGGVIVGLIAGRIMELDQELVYKLVKDGPIFRLISERGFVLSMGVYWGMLGGVTVAIFGGLNSKIVEAKTISNQGIALSARNALLTGPGFGLIIGGLVAGLLDGLFYGFGNAVDWGLFWGLVMGIIACAWYGGLDIIQHYTLRVILWYRGQTPFIYSRFLNHAAERIFLQKVGGGYIFIHRLLLEHFAGLGTAETAEER
jgi:hypothetical protein